MNSKLIGIIAIIIVLIGIGIVAGFSFQGNEISSISPDNSSPRIITRSLTEDVGVASEP